MRQKFRQNLLDGGLEIITVDSLPYHCAPVGDTDYFASTCGQIISLKAAAPRILKQCRIKNGYTQVDLMGLGESQNYVHRVVAFAFLEDPDPSAKGDIRDQVNHKNGRRDDNHIRNLEYVSAKENKEHALIMAAINK